MRHLDLSFEGRRLSDRDQPDNGIRPHGGYRGSKRHPMCHFSYDKGREFHHKMEEEIDRLILSNELALHGTSPSWSLAVHREPSYTDESPLITNQYLAASKTASSSGVTLHNRSSLLPPKKMFKPQKRESTQFYRPNSTHQYLSATELKNASEGDVNVLYGRPTRTTLLRARQRCTSAPLNNHGKRRESEPKIDDYRSCYSVPSNIENLQLDKDGETLHSFLTGARYNRAHCLDARSVDHTGVYMPRNNTAMGCFFTGPKGQEYIKEFEATTPRSDSMPSPRLIPPASPKRRPTTAPGHGNRGNRPVTVTAPSSPPRARRQAWSITTNGAASSRYKSLNVVGCRLPIGMSKEMALRLPSLQPISGSRKPQGLPPTEESYRGYQPPPTPTSLQQQSQEPPTDRRLEGAEEVDHPLVSERFDKDLDVGTPVTQVVVKNNGGDDDKMMTMTMNDDEVDEKEIEKGEEEETLEEKKEVEEEEEEEVVAVVEDKKIEEEEEVKDEVDEKKEEVVVEEDGDDWAEEKKEVEDELVEDDEDVKEEEHVEEKEVVVEDDKNDDIHDDIKEENIEQVEEVEVVGVECDDKEEEEKAEEEAVVERKETVEEKRKEEVEEREEETEKSQKEVRFFITEKDKEEEVDEMDSGDDLYCLG